MLEKFSQSSGNILGYKILGKITKKDYETLEEDIEGLVQQENTFAYCWNLILMLANL